MNKRILQPNNDKLIVRMLFDINRKSTRKHIKLSLSNV